MFVYTALGAIEASPFTNEGRLTEFNGQVLSSGCASCLVASPSKMVRRLPTEVTLNMLAQCREFGLSRRKSEDPICRR